MSQMQKFKEQFDQCDIDKDGRLKQDEFIQFVRKALNKPCPPAMYTTLCQHFQISVDVGLEWSHTKDVLLQSNSNNKPSNPAPKQNPNQNSNSGQTQPQTQPQPQHQSQPQPQHQSQPQPQSQSQIQPQGQNQSPSQTSPTLNSPVINSPTQLSPTYTTPVVVNDSASVDDPRNQVNSNIENKVVSPNAQGSQRGRTSQIQRPVHRFASPQPPSNNNLNNNNSLEETRSVGPTINLTDSNGPDSKYFRRGTGTAKGEQLLENNSSNGLNSENSGAGLTEKALKHHEYQNSISDSQLEDIDADAENGRKPLHTATRSRSRLDALDRLDRRTSLASDSGEATSEMQIMSMMESKLNATKKELDKEKQKRKQTESLMQQLLQQNDQYKNQITELQNQLKTLRQDHEKENERNAQQLEGLRTKLSKLQSQVDTERTKGTHIETQNATLSSERDEAYRLLRKIEKEHETKIQKLKAKHTEELEQISNGFLQSLGVESGQDVSIMMKQLKEKNESLRQQVDMLAETLARKEQSLLEALQAVDDISTTTMDDETLIQDVMVDSIQDTQKTGLGRQSSLMGKLRKKPNNNNNNNNNNNTAETNIYNPNNVTMITLPKPGHMAQQRSGSWNSHSYSNGGGNGYSNSNRAVSPAPYNPDLNASFFKNASTNNRQLQTQAGLSQPIMQPKSQNSKEKQMEFLSKSLATDVAKKQDAIVNLEMANSVLGKQVADLQRQLQDIRQPRRDSATPSLADQEKPENNNNNTNGITTSLITNSDRNEITNVSLITATVSDLP